MAERPTHIGTLRENPLHASLKRWYAHPDDGIEVPMDGFVIDLVRDDLLIEVQTRGFSSLKPKVVALLSLGRRVRIVFPIPVEKWIIKVDAESVVLSRRRSPKRGSPIDVFAELVSFPELMSHPNLELEVLLINEEEFRHQTPGRSWRRHGWSILERRLIEVVDSLPLGQLEHLAALLPLGLPELFTTADLAAGLGQPRRVAQQMAYCLRKIGAIVAVGRRGQEVVYRVRQPADLVGTSAESTER